jgi:hypothetical protein
MKASGEILNEMDAAVVVSDPKKAKGQKMVNKDLSPLYEDGDVASKLSDLSETSTDNGLQRHDDMAMMEQTTSSNNNSKSNKNRHKLRSERSEDYENFEKMLRNKHSKACKAMSVSRNTRAFLHTNSFLSIKIFLTRWLVTCPILLRPCMNYHRLERTVRH